MNKLSNLQAARGIAALLVLLFHLSEAELKNYLSGLHLFYPLKFYGFAGVDLFFVISGFIITLVSYKNFAGSSRDIKRYFLKRIIRIYPIYWFYFAVVLTTCLLKLNNALVGVVPADFIKSFLLLTQYNALLPIAWTLVHELFFYCTVGAFLFFEIKAFTVGLWVWLALILTVNVFFYAHLPDYGNLAHYLFSPFNLEFIMGCAIALWLQRKGTSTSKAGLTGFLGIFFFLLSGGIYYFGFLDLGHDVFLRVLLFGPSCALLIYSLTCFEISGKLLMPAWLVRIGNASYSIYLCHLFVFAVLRRLLGRLEVLGLGGHVTAYVVMFFTAIGVGIISYKYVENPLIRILSRWALPKPKVIDPGFQPLTNEEQSVTRNT